jgi:hypothetical protein
VIPLAIIDYSGVSREHEISGVIAEKKRNRPCSGRAHAESAYWIVVRGIAECKRVSVSVCCACFHPERQAKNLAGNQT